MTENKPKSTFEDRMNTSGAVTSYFGEEGEKKLKELESKQVPRDSIKAD